MRRKYFCELKLLDNLNLAVITAAYVPFAYCPSIFGCRALIHHKELPELTRFWIDNNYNASFHYNASQNGPLYIVSFFFQT